MPRDGSGVYSAPAGTTATAGTTIESAKYNAFVSDLTTDANTARPIVAGGTGATTAGAALTALGGQPFDADLTSWAAITRASGFDTFATTPSSANLRALLTDEVGTGAAYFVGGALGTPASVTLTNGTGLPFAGLAAAAVTDSTETIAANNVDTQVPTSKAVYDVSGRVLLSSQTASASATLNFTAFNNAIYRYYEFEFENVKPATNASGFQLRVSTDGGATYDSGAATYAYAGVAYNATGSVSFGTNTGTLIQISNTNDLGNGASAFGLTGKMQLYNAGDAASQSRVVFAGNYDNSAASAPVGVTLAGRRLAAQDTDAIQFFFSAGNIASGVIRMYGVLK